MARRTSTTAFEAHGEPLGEDEVRLVKQFFGFDPDASFVVPDGVREHFAASMGARGAALRRDWQALFARYRAAYPDLAGADRPHPQSHIAGWLGAGAFRHSRPMPRAWRRAMRPAKC